MGFHEGLLDVLSSAANLRGGDIMGKIGKFLKTAEDIADATQGDAGLDVPIGGQGAKSGPGGRPIGVPGPDQKKLKLGGSIPQLPDNPAQGLSQASPGALPPVQTRPNATVDAVIQNAISQGVRSTRQPANPTSRGLPLQSPRGLR